MTDVLYFLPPAWMNAPAGLLSWNQLAREKRAGLSRPAGPGRGLFIFEPGQVFLQRIGKLASFRNFCDRWRANTQVSDRARHSLATGENVKSLH